MKPRLYHLADLPVDRYAARFDLRPVETAPGSPGFHLFYDRSGMTLCNGPADPLTLRYRDIEARAGQTLLLARACAAARRPMVADLMAGWGTDGLALALRGCTVTLVERSPLVWAMLDEFVARHQLPVTVVCALAQQWCRDNRKAVDVAYLDPMFPARRKTALPSRRMQLLREVAWPDDMPLGQQIALARATARDRVVVKRRARDPATLSPAWTLRGRSIRYDIYQAS